MQKRVFIIHSWDGHPKEGWYPWLKKELEKRNFKVVVPSMPNSAEPKIDEWVNCLSSIAEEVDKNTYFIGHSIGCQAILRYLEKIKKDKKIGGLICVAGWFKLKNLESKEEWKIAKPWLETPINFTKIKNVTNNITAIFSDNDPFVSLENKKLFASKLGSEILTEKKKGHFSGSDGIKKLPSALKAVLEMSEKNK